MLWRTKKFKKIISELEKRIGALELEVKKLSGAEPAQNSATEEELTTKQMINEWLNGEAK